MSINNNIIKFKTIAFLLFFSIITANSARADEEIIISAAASLTGVMKKIKISFEKSNPFVNLVFNFASSGALLQQIRLGAPVDVYLSASNDFMDRAEKNNLIIKGTRKNFASGRLVLITYTDSSLSLSAPRELLLPEIKRLAIGNPKTVPAGRYARTALLHAGIWEELKSKLIYANSVRQVLEYTNRGEVDAGFVYATDSLLAGKTKTIMEIKNTGPITYPVAVTSNTRHRKAAIRFIEFLQSEKGKEIFVSFGFD